MSKLVEIKLNKNSLANLANGVRFKKGQKPWNAGKMNMVTFDCATCSVSVTRQYKKDRSNRFCSVACSNKALHTPEIMERSRIARTGIRRTDEQRKRFSGEKSWNWRGGLTKINTAIRNSFEYKQWRKHIFQRDDYTCQACGERGGKLHADHVMPFTHFSDLRFEILNGRTLCVECHRKTETYGGRAVKYSYV